MTDHPIAPDGAPLSRGMVFEPPRHSKTYHTSERSPSWTIGRNPRWRMDMPDQQPTDPSEPHAYQRACRNTQHSGCTCMHPIDGRWCGRARNDPIHDVQATAEAPPWLASTATWLVHGR